MKTWLLLTLLIYLNTQQVPFDKITDCDIVEPAGNTCFCVPNTLHTVHVDTASSDKERHELTISGLRDPTAFKKLVWAMKREYHPAYARLPPAVDAVGRGDTKSDSGGSGDVATLLREIRDELRANNQYLQSMKQKPAPSAPTDASDV